MVELMDKRTLKIDVIGPVEGTDICGKKFSEGK